MSIKCSKKYLKLNDIYDEILAPTAFDLKYSHQAQVRENFIKNNTSVKSYPLVHWLFQQNLIRTLQNYDTQRWETDKSLSLISQLSLKKSKYFINEQIEQQDLQLKHQQKILIKSESKFSQYFSQKGIILTSKKDSIQIQKTKQKIEISQTEKQRDFQQVPIGRQGIAMKPKSLIN